MQRFDQIGDGSPCCYNDQFKKLEVNFGDTGLKIWVANDDFAIAEGLGMRQTNNVNDHI